MMGEKGDVSKFLPKKRLMGEITECYILLNSVYLKFEVILLYNLGIFKKK